MNIYLFNIFLLIEHFILLIFIFKKCYWDKKRHMFYRKFFPIKIVGKAIE